MDKEYQLFAQWCWAQSRFRYNQYTNKWESLQYVPKTTLQLFRYFQNGQKFN